MDTEEPSNDTSTAEMKHVIAADELNEGERVIVEIKGREIAVFNVEGSFHALANYCVHQGGPVCEGQISGALFEKDGELVWGKEDQIVSCPWHGWEFEIESGRHLTNKSYRIPSYDVVERDGELYIDL